MSELRDIAKIGRVAWSTTPNGPPTFRDFDEVAMDLNAGELRVTLRGQVDTYPLHEIHHFWIGARGLTDRTFPQ